jgi:hypothetical protein
MGALVDGVAWVKQVLAGSSLGRDGFGLGNFLCPRRHHPYRCPGRFWPDRFINQLIEENAVGFVSRLFGSTPVAAKAAQTQPGSTRAPLPDRDATHRQLLVMAVQDTLRTHGIPATWLTTETLTAAIGAKKRGMHLRLILRDSRLLPYAMDLQKSVHARIARLDPLSPSWMAGISWKLEVAGDGPCLQLPNAGYWQRVISNPPTQAAAPMATAPVPALPRAVLDRLLGSIDSKFRDSQQDRPDFSPTQPMESHAVSVGV